MTIISVNEKQIEAAVGFICTPNKYFLGGYAYIRSSIWDEIRKNVDKGIYRVGTAGYYITFLESRPGVVDIEVLVDPSVSQDPDYKEIEID